MSFRFDRALGFAVNRTAYIMRGRFRAGLEEAGLDLTPEEAVILARLNLTDGLRQSVLADSTIREKSTVTRLLDNLVGKGYVRRENDRSDRRVVLAWLTDPGREAHDRAFEVAQCVLRVATKGVSKKDLDITMRTLGRVQENLIAAEAIEHEKVRT